MTLALSSFHPTIIPVIEEKTKAQGHTTVRSSQVNLTQKPRLLRSTGFCHLQRSCVGTLHHSESSVCWKVPPSMESQIAFHLKYNVYIKRKGRKESLGARCILTDQ